MSKQDKTIITPVDLSQQPATSHVVIIPDMRRTEVGVDYWEILNGMFVGSVKYLREDQALEPVVSFTNQSPWAVFHRSLIKSISMEEAMDKASPETKGMAAMLAKLMDGQGDGEGGHGQYL